MQSIDPLPAIKTTGMLRCMGKGNDIYIISRLNNSYKDKKNISIIIDEENGKDKVENGKEIRDHFYSSHYY